jgi:hypothetical protein
MPSKLTIKDVDEFIKSKGYELVSNEYNGNKDMLKVKCKNCGELFNQKLYRMKMGKFHQYCKEETKEETKKQRILKPIECIYCVKTFQPKYLKTKLCSKKCSIDFSRRDEYKEIAKRNGQKGGQISAKNQSKRSKNEVYFSELCIEHFGKENVTTNETYFDGWDADVIIHHKKLAILWNGAWHYKQISKTQSLLQVQTRDDIKIKIIEKYGYTPYIIKDLGKYNKIFVKQQFEILIQTEDIFNHL